MCEETLPALSAIGCSEEVLDNPSGWPWNDSPLSNSFQVPLLRRTSECVIV